MTAPSRSVLDEYLPGYARERGSGSRRRVMLDDMPDLIERMRRARTLPKGQGRGAAFRAIADDFGVTVRTLQRYWATAELTRVRCDGWQALFLIRDGAAPRQASAWERAA